MLTPIAVTARYVTGTNQPCAGRVDFVLTKVMRDTVTGVIVDKEVDSDGLDGAGAMAITIFATDDVDVLPTGAVYHVTERITGAPRYQYPMALSHTSPGATFDLSSLG